MAVEDALKDDTINKLIDRVRSVSKHLRTTNAKLLLQKSGYKCPIIDYITRWHSRHDMLERLLELRPFCESGNKIDDYNVHLSMNEWYSIKTFVEANRTGIETS